jgi:hypothetical protein
MTIRAVILGLLLGLFISGFTYFNDWVIRQTYLIGNHLPVGVFGPAMILLLLINPLLGMISPRLPLKAGELAVVIGIGLAACAWPGSNLYRVFIGAMGRTATYEQVKPAWQSGRVRAYVPGGSGELAEGYVRDWHGLAQALVEAEAGDTPRGALWHRFDTQTREAIAEAAQRGIVEPRERQLILDAVNVALTQPDLFDPQAQQSSTATGADLVAASHARRDALTDAFPGIITRRPSGEGAIPLGGAFDPYVSGTLVTGAQLTPPPPGETLGNRLRRTMAMHVESVAAVPWDAWWPTIRLWIGAALFMGIACVCLTLIVHPQWAHRELLLYPTAQFVKDVTQREPGRLLPTITADRLFWIGLVGVAALHTVNGLSAWFPTVPRIDRQFNLTPLYQLFPNAQRVSGAWGLFQPQLFFTAIGFGYFINARVSMSLGLSTLLWVVLGATLISQGVPMGVDRYDPHATGNAMRFGSWVGAVVMILYFGRRHYLDVLRGGIGLSIHAHTPRYCIWAMRGLVASCLITIALLMNYAALSATMSVLLVGMVLIFSLVLTRINAETGLFYGQPDFLPAALLAGFFGLRGVGPEAYVILTLAGIVLVIDPREALMPYLANALRMGDQVADTRPSRLAHPLLAMVVVGLVVTTVVTFAIHYRMGASPHDGWMLWQAQAPLDRLASANAALAARGELAQAVGLSWFDHFRQMKPDPKIVWWALGGIALYVGCAVARVRFPWWPLHPVLFLVWGTYPITHFAFSFLIAALVKSSVVKFGGLTTYHRVKPLMVGLIAGEILAAVGWMIVGTAYYFNTGLAPVSYRILPG